MLGGAKRGLGPGLADQRRLGSRRPLDDAGQTAESQPGLGHLIALQAQRQAGADCGDVAVEALGQLVGLHHPVRVGQRNGHRLDELARVQLVLHVVEVEVLQRQITRRVAAAQGEHRAQRDQHRRGVANRRAVGQVAHQRAGVPHWRPCKAPAHFGQGRPQPHQLGPTVFQRDGGADAQLAVGMGDAPKLGHVPQVDQLAELAQLLGDPQADVRGTGQQARVWLRLEKARQRRQGARRMKAARFADRCIGLQGAETGRQAFQRQPRARCVQHAFARIEDGPVAGAAAEVAAQGVGKLGACRAGLALRVSLVAGRQRDSKPRRAKAALRAVRRHQGTLRRMQVAGRREILHRQQRLAVQRGQEADAGVDGAKREARTSNGLAWLGHVAGQLGDQQRAGAAIAFGAAFLAATGTGVLPQPLQHAAGGPVVGQLDGLAAKDKTDRAVDAHGATVLRMGLVECG